MLAPTPRAIVPPLQPIVSQGTTLLADSLVAVRSGDSVTLHFDTPAARTRRPEKFEQIVRSTLPAIYGPSVSSLLARIPIGRLAQAGDLLTDLPTRGLRLSLGAGWILGVWPETRSWPRWTAGRHLSHARDAVAQGRAHGARLVYCLGTAGPVTASAMTC